MLLVTRDLIPRLAMDGFDSIIEEVSMLSLEGLALLNSIADRSGVNLTEDLLTQYILDRKEAGYLTNVSMVNASNELTFIPRLDAPAGLGKNENGIWFSQPASGIRLVRWYKNGQLVLTREQDLSQDRGITLVELNATVGDIITICFEQSGQVGWWARIDV